MPYDPRDSARAQSIDDVLAAIEASPDANSGDPVADLFTWEDHPAANIPMPEEALPPISTPTPGVHGGRHSEGGSVSLATRGMTEGGLKKAKGVFGEADVRAQARSAEEDAFYQDDVARSREHYNAVNEALEEAVGKTQEFAAADEEIRQREIDFQKGEAELEARLAGEAQADRAQYVAAYKEQLAVVRQLSLQSGNPMGKLSQGEALGLAGAQFAQGFLAAQGIHIDVAGQVDRWVERSIQEHQMKITNARDAANDQMHLYEIARQNSEDEWEARQRYRGFVIAGLQSSIQLNASRFQSDIAMARAHEQGARLQIEADTTERAIANSHFERRAAVYQQEYGRARDMGQLAIEQHKASIEAKRAAWDMDPRNPKNVIKKDPASAAPPDFRIADVEYMKNPDGTDMVDASGNRIMQNRWRVNSETMKDDVLARKVYQDAMEARNNFADYDDATRKMTEAYTKAKKVRDAAGIWQKMTWDALGRTTGSEDVNNYVQLRNAWAQKRVKLISGTAASDSERKVIAEQAYADKFFADNGSKAEKSMAILRQQGVDEFTRKMEGFQMEQIPEGDPGRIYRSVQAAPQTNATQEAILTGERAEPGFADVTAASALDRGSREVVSNNPSGAWADFQSDVQRPRGDKIDLGQPDYAVQLDRLVAAYAKPHWFTSRSQEFGVSKQKEETPSEIRREAYAAFDRLARGIAVNEDGSVAEVGAHVVEYASYLKDKIDNDPVLGPLRNQQGDAEDIEDAPLIQTMQPARKRK